MLGFQPVEAMNAQEARFVLAQRQLAIVVADHDLMDGSNGLDVLTSVERDQPSALRVLMSGTHRLASLVRRPVSSIRVRAGDRK